MSYTTASALLRGLWLIDKGYVSKHLPLVMRLMQGEPVDFGMDKDTSTEAVAMHMSPKGGAVYSVGYYTKLETLPEGSIARLSISGPIMKHGDLCSYGSKDHTATIQRLRNAGNIHGVILDVDSPGGQVYGTSMLADAIKELASAKPVIGMIDDGISASAAMWIVSACTEVYTTKPTDQVGSIGVYTTIADWYGYFEAQGLKVREVYAPQSTDKNKNYHDAVAGDEDGLKQELSVIAAEFISTIKANRGSRLKGEDWATGKMYYSKEAARIGLIDGMRSPAQVVQRMDTLIRKQQQSSNKSNTMAFEKTLKVAGATEFEVVDGGFLLEETHLNNVEQALDAAAGQEETIATLQEQVTTMTSLRDAATEALAEANTNLQTSQTRITELEADVQRLQGESSGKKGSTAVNPGADDMHDGKQNTGPVGLMSDDHPLNKMADRLTRKAKKQD